MSQSQTSSVIRSLENVRERVKQRLLKVPEYRAFLAIEAPIAEVADISDLVAHLQAAKQRILERLAATKEYEALLTVEKAIKDISDVLDVVAEDGSLDTALASSEKVIGKNDLSEVAAASGAATQQSLREVAADPVAKASPAMASQTAVVTEMPAADARDASGPTAAAEPAEQHPDKAVAAPAERFSTLGLVEEWRLTTMVRESFSANADGEAGPAGESKPEAEKAKVA
jgi:hypothetical protein